MRYSGLIEANLRRLWDAATETERSAGLTWYRDAHAECSMVAGELELPVKSFIGIVAALSPGLRWDRNIADAARLVQALKSGGPVPLIGVYGRRNQSKAVAIFNGADPESVLGGFKVRSFFYNIWTPDSNTSITVDRHAYCAAVNRRSQRDPKWTRDHGGKFPPIDKPRWYRWVSQHYERLAAKLGVLAHQLQAVVWTVWRRIVGAVEVEA